jgi:uncharacterized protein YkwD
MPHAAARPFRPASSLVAATVLAVGVGLLAPAPASALTVSDARGAVVKLTNKARVAKGCDPLKVSTRLTTAAQKHAADMDAKDYFSHTSINGRTWVQRIKATGWKKPAGENIAYGYESGAAVHKGWMNSPGHKRNILDCSFNYIGVGYSASGDYWVQDFGY